MKTRLHYGWVMVFCSMAILAVNSQAFYSFSIFLRNVTEEFHWHRGAMSGVLTVTMLVGTPLSVLTGRLSDKYGSRLLLTASGVIGFTGYILLSQIHALWQFYLLFGVVIAIGNSLCMIPITSSIPRWFAQRRGIALGLVFAGNTFGGIIGPLLVQWITAAYSWRWAYAVISVMVLVVFVPLAQLLKQSPETMGIKPYGEITSPQPGKITTRSLTLKQSIRTSQFWIIGLVMMCLFFIGQTILSQIAPHISDIGLNENLGAAVLSLYAATSLAGTLISGFLVERAGIKKTILLSFSVILATLIMLMFINESWMFYLFTVFYGTAFGIMIPIQTSAPSEFFGLLSLGTISATLNVIGALGGATGPPLAGAIFDATGRYQRAFIIAIGMSVMGIILTLMLRQPAEKEVAKG